MTTIYYAEVETSHFTFRAAGATEAQAREALMAAWRYHVRNTRRQGGYIDPDYVNIDDANVLEMRLGQGFLDWSPAGKAVKERARRCESKGCTVDATCSTSGGLGTFWFCGYHMAHGADL